MPFSILFRCWSERGLHPKLCHQVHQTKHFALPVCCSKAWHNYQAFQFQKKARSSCAVSCWIDEANHYFSDKLIWAFNRTTVVVALWRKVGRRESDMIYTNIALRLRDREIAPAQPVHPSGRVDDSSPWWMSYLHWSPKTAAPGWMSFRSAGESSTRDSSAKSNPLRISLWYGAPRPGVTCQQLTHYFILFLWLLSVLFGCVIGI